MTTPAICVLVPFNPSIYPGRYTTASHSLGTSLKDIVSLLHDLGS